jgi:prepilin-type N-terminal cleavage/methylation domain-containing protein
MKSRSFPFNSAQRTLLRAFTLIELMVTVAIIGLLAAIAAPGVYQRVNNYAARQAAEAVATTVRLARLRAMGRGAAVRVLVSAGGNTTVQEAVLGNLATAGCTTLPDLGCNFRANSTQRTWTNGTDSEQVQSFDHTAGGTYSVALAQGSSGTTLTNLDICFPPSGRALIDPNGSGTYSALTQVVQVAMTPTGGGLTRDVLVLPNGTARVQARKAP